MDLLSESIKLYHNCTTNKGQLIGTCGDVLFIRTAEKQVVEFKTADIGKNLFLYLRKLQDLNETESKALIKEGIAIGRPHGYTFPATDSCIYYP